MSEDDKHVIIGRLVSEYQKIRVEREFLKAKAHGLGAEMSKLGALLEKYALSDASSQLGMSNTTFPELRETLSRYAEIENQGEAIRSQLDGLGIKQAY